MTSEGGVMIKDYGSRHAMEFKNLIDENLGNQSWCERVWKCTKVIIHGEEVNNNHDD
jgi:hypothetical protein